MKNIINSFKLIPEIYRFKSYLLIIFLFIGSILEIIGIGIFLPLLNELTNSNIIYVNNFKIFLKQNFSIDENQIIHVFLSLICSIFLFKNFFLAFLIYFQNTYIERINTYLSSKLLEIYLKQNYLFFKAHNTSLLIRNINVEISTFIVLLTNIFRFISEIFFLLGILIVLFLIDQQFTTLSLLFFILIAFLYNLITRKFVKKIGETRHKFAATTLKNLQQSLGAIKEIKIGNFEIDFIRIYRYSASKVNKSINYFSTVQQLPRLIFELTIVIVVSILISLLIGKSYASGNILAIVGIYSISAVKIIPSVIKIYSSIQQMNFTKSVVDTLKNDLERIKKIDEKKENIDISFNDFLELRKIYFDYSNTKYPALENISIKFSKNTSTAIIGESGAGKSTLLDIILGLIRPKDGDIFVDNIKYDLNNLNWHKKIGYVPQSVYLVDDTIVKNITLGKDINTIDKKRLMEVIRFSNLSDLVDSLPNGIETNIGEMGEKLSLGQRQRIGIARALYTNAEILIFDEPTSSLDNENEKKIMKKIFELKNKTIIFITHKIELLENFDKIIKLKKGKLI